MDKNKFIQLASNPNLITSSDEAVLRAIAERFPFFQAARVLLAKATGGLSEEVKTAAAYTQNRRILKSIMNSEFDANINLPSAAKLSISYEHDLNAFEKLSSAKSAAANVVSTPQPQTDRSEDHEFNWPTFEPLEKESEKLPEVAVEETKESEPSEDHEFNWPTFEPLEKESEKLPEVAVEETKESEPSEDHEFNWPTFEPLEKESEKSTELEVEATKEPESTEDHEFNWPTFEPLEKESEKSSELEEEVTKEPESAADHEFNWPTFEPLEKESEKSSELEAEATKASDITEDEEFNWPKFEPLGKEQDEERTSVPEVKPEPKVEAPVQSTQQAKKVEDTIPTDEELLARFQRFTRTREEINKLDHSSEEEDTEFAAELALLRDNTPKKVLKPGEDKPWVVPPESLPFYGELAKRATLSSEVSRKSIAALSQSELISPSSFSLFKKVGGKSLLDKDYQQQVIEKFISKSPRISSAKTEPELVQEDLSTEATELSGPLAENYAKFLVKQGKTQEAIKIYKTLMLKNPNKKSYFASRIELLDKNQY
ncbi:hypothetical protein V6R21_22070 [Limibacter armeniacum]|uniref:hypothetical protein n=1 Tax=Limibacter armeniacum TaxID=466084 RepID=UPI002FE55DB0